MIDVNLFFPDPESYEMFIMTLFEWWAVQTFRLQTLQAKTTPETAIKNVYNVYIS